MRMAQFLTRIKLLAKIQTNTYEDYPLFKFIRCIVYYIIIGQPTKTFN